MISSSRRESSSRSALPHSGSLRDPSGPVPLSSYTILHGRSFLCVATTARCCYLLLPPRGDSTPPLLSTNRHVLRALRARSTRRRLLTSSGPVSSVLMKGKRLPRCCCRAAAAALLLPRRCCCCCCTLPLCALPLYFVMSPPIKPWRQHHDHLCSPCRTAGRYATPAALYLFLHI